MKLNLGGYRAIGAAVRLAGAVVAAACTAAAGASAAEHVIHVSVDGLRPDFLQDLVEVGEAPNFARLQLEGAWTHNGRTDYFDTTTMPNHTTMVTGRPVLQPAGLANTVHHGWEANGDPSASTTLHNSGNQNVPYKASTFDVAHDAGLSTALYASKSRFVLFDQSYNAANGAPHAHGSDKIDVFASPKDNSWSQEQVLAGLAANNFNYTFVLYNDPDGNGHNSGWGGEAYMESLRTIDGYLGELLVLAESDPELVGRTAIILTADHGGSGTGHGTATDPDHYIVPFYVWGAGIAAGDLYALNHDTRSNPGIARPTYTAASQPIRNGDSGNLALSLLGLPPIPGSFINVGQDLRVATPGDFDGSGVVDGADLVIWQAGWGGVGGRSHFEGDADADRDVDGDDFLVWQRRVGAASGATSMFEAIPEPSGWALGTWGLALAVRLRGRVRLHGGVDGADANDRPCW